MSYLTVTHTVSDIVTHIKRQFGDESGAQITDADIIRWANQGQEEIFRRSDPIKATATANLVMSQIDYTFPNDILKVQSIEIAGRPLDYKSHQEADEYIKNADPNRIQTGTPTMWYEWGGTFTLWPTPDGSVTNGIVIKYIKAPAVATDLGSMLSIPDVYFNRLLEFIMAQAYELDENWQAAATKAEQFGTNLDAQTGQDSVAYDTYPRITVLPEDSGWY